MDKFWLQHELLNKSSWISLVLVLAKHASTTRDNVGWFNVTSRDSSGRAFGCSIRADIIQNLAETVLKTFGKTAKTITPAELGTILRRKVVTHTKKKPITEVMRLAPNNGNTKGHFLEVMDGIISRNVLLTGFQ